MGARAAPGPGPTLRLAKGGAKLFVGAFVGAEYGLDAFLIPRDFFVCAA